jgi:hypothetical protein
MLRISLTDSITRNDTLYHPWNIINDDVQSNVTKCECFGCDAFVHLPNQLSLGARSLLHFELLFLGIKDHSCWDTSEKIGNSIKRCSLGKTLLVLQQIANDDGDAGDEYIDEESTMISESSDTD